EEIPARMQARAAADLKRLIEDGLKKAGLTWDSSAAYVTPRRLCLVVDGLPEKQADVKDERKGPQTSAPEQALKGFLGSLGGLSLDDCEQRDIKGKTFYVAVIEKKGAPTSDVLPKVLTAAFEALPWPKSMRWGTSTKRWVRPLHNILALFDGNVVDVAYEDVRANGQTFGHRFLNPDAITVSDFADYKTKLHDAHVMLDPAERRASIEKQAAKLAADAGLSVKPDEGLLQEVTGLVEWPVVLLGNIDESFMDLPPEVLTDTMKVHQKYFSLLKSDGTLAPNFLTVANQVASDGGKAITAGNERVLRARLSDAKFFWDQDRKTSLADLAPKLKDIVFHAKLGSVAEKVYRVKSLAGSIAGEIGADKAHAQRAAELCKCDLVTGMVYEIPEVQGVIGRYYALNDGEALDVANAIAEHYSPAGPGDACPTAPVSTAVAMADKIDTLVGFWTIDEKPTGSKDPFALRRAALGVIRIIIENKLRLPLLDVFAKAGGKDIAVNLLSFFADRLKVHLKSQGVRHDLIDAVFALGGKGDLVRLLARVEALSGFVGSDDGANLLAAHKRAANILRIEQKKDKTSYNGMVDESAFEQDEERTLFQALAAASGKAHAYVEAERFEDAMAVLATLRGPLDAFFDGVMVNVDDKKVRINRLLLLSEIIKVMGEIADFSKIEG
ncbi:MAG: glycine--tRNA ligase subunit beta, partial [Magnetovibrio sp.]|nr:glycine--tRNA ligase subunit beta [Magnetovibrio sp.]